MSVSSPTPRAIEDARADEQRSPARDRLARRLILAAGALCFALLAWGHLGLGALVAPPPQTTTQQTVASGPLIAKLTLDSGQLKAAGPNTLALTVTDRAGHPIANAAVTEHPVMRTMAMDAPSVAAVRDAKGDYLTRPRFAMAGEWRIDATITRPGYPPQLVTFNVTVRW